MIAPQLREYFIESFSKGASDLLLSVGAYPSYKRFGEIVPIEGKPILRMKDVEEYILSILTPEQKKIFEQHSDIDFSITVPDIGRFRVNMYVQRRGVAAVFRPIPEHVRSIDELQLPDILKKITTYRSGLVLVTGTVGSGKTTTLAALTEEINRTQRKHIITVEDPIEFVYDNQLSLVDQREVGHHTKTFKTALRQALREAPDVIYIGEMRDYETISLAITAAETGVLVLGTLHTAGAAKAVNRIIDVFPSEQQNQVRSQLADSLKAVIWQQLIKKQDGSGVAPAMEILLHTPAVASMIRRSNTHQLPSAIETGRAQGMVSMRHSLELLQSSGAISKEQADSYLPQDSEL